MVKSTDEVIVGWGGWVMETSCFFYSMLFNACLIFWIEDISYGLSTYCIVSRLLREIQTFVSNRICRKKTFDSAALKYFYQSITTLSSYHFIK